MDSLDGIDKPIPFPRNADRNERAELLDTLDFIGRKL